MWIRNGPYRLAQNPNQSENYWSKCETVTWMNLIAIVVFCGNLADKCFSQGSKNHLVQIELKSIVLFLKFLNKIRLYNIYQFNVTIYSRTTLSLSKDPCFSYGFDHSDLILELFSNHGYV